MENQTFESLLEIGQLRDLLGYKDDRSVKKWCQREKITFVYIGKKVYVSKILIDEYVTRQFSFSPNPTSDDKTTEKTKQQIHREIKVKKISNCKAADDFLKKIKAA